MTWAKQICRANAAISRVSQRLGAQPFPRFEEDALLPFAAMNFRSGRGRRERYEQRDSNRNHPSGKFAGQAP